MHGTSVAVLFSVCRYLSTCLFVSRRVFCSLIECVVQGIYSSFLSALLPSSMIAQASFLASSVVPMLYCIKMPTPMVRLLKKYVLQNRMSRRRKHWEDFVCHTSSTSFTIESNATIVRWRLTLWPCSLFYQAIIFEFAIGGVF